MVEHDTLDLFFIGVGGSRIHAKYLRPKARSGKLPAVLMFHGYPGRSTDWSEYLGWVGQGFCVAVLDCRGQNGLSEDRGSVSGSTLNSHITRGLLDDDPRKLTFRNVFLDTAQLAGIVMNQSEVDPARVGVTGGSQGGALTLVCAALEPRIKLAAATYPFLSDYRRAWEMSLPNVYRDLTNFFRLYDPQHKRLDDWFLRLGYIDVQHFAKRVRAKVLMSVGLVDVNCPPSTQFAVYNKLTCPKELAIYPEFAHEDFPGSRDQILTFMLGL
jgi:cephalosporin-C deacetylase